MPYLQTCSRAAPCLTVPRRPTRLLLVPLAHTVCHHQEHSQLVSVIAVPACVSRMLCSAPVSLTCCSAVVRVLPLAAFCVRCHARRAREWCVIQTVSALASLQVLGACPVRVGKDLTQRRAISTVATHCVCVTLSEVLLRLMRSRDWRVGWLAVVCQQPKGVLDTRNHGVRGYATRHWVWGRNMPL